MSDGVDWKARCAEQEDKLVRLADAIRLQKEQWAKTLEEQGGQLDYAQKASLAANQQIEEWRTKHNQLEVRLRDSEEQNRQAKKQLEALKALADMKPEPDTERLAELEKLVSEQATDLKVAKKDLDEKLKEAKAKNSEQLVENRVLLQKVADLEVQLEHANDRAFEAESRLGRSQKSYKEAMAEKNRLALLLSQNKIVDTGASKSGDLDLDEDITVDASSLAELDALHSELAAGVEGLDDLDLDAELSKVGSSASASKPSKAKDEKVKSPRGKEEPTKPAKEEPKKSKEKEEKVKSPRGKGDDKKDKKEEKKEEKVKQKEEKVKSPRGKADDSKSKAKVEEPKKSDDKKAAKTEAPKEVAKKPSQQAMAKSAGVTWNELDDLLKSM